MAAATRRRSVAVVCLFAFVALVAGGCARSEPPPTPQQIHLKMLAVLYGRYVGSHRGSAPPNEQAFRDFVRKNSASEQKTFGLSDVDALFVSPRDREPYVVLYGGKLAAPGAEGAPVIAYERVGLNGKRMVATALGAAHEVDAAEWDEIAASLPTERRPERTAR